jgi:hypothetical protein
MKLQQICSNIGGAIAIGILHKVPGIRNASLFREFEAGRNRGPRIGRYLYIQHIAAREWVWFSWLLIGCADWACTCPLEPHTGAGAT